MARIAIAGSWHQATVHAACLAELGHEVVMIVEPSRLADFQAGRLPVHEPGLAELTSAQVAAGRLGYTADYGRGLAGAEFVFVAIDTPVDEEDRSDLGPIEAAVDAIAAAASAALVVCIGAQVPIGTTERMGTRLNGQPVAYVPEFLRLGTALETFRQADRFVVGCDDPAVAARIAALYAGLGRPVHLTSVRSAEMAKHASNAFLATSISFANEIADLCEVTGADVTEVAAVLRLDSRIGPRAFLSAGLGYAGGTLGREIKTLHAVGAERGVPTDLLDAVDEVNGRRLSSLEQRLEKALDRARRPHVAVLGLAYKPGTSTLRRSAALELIGHLVARGAEVSAFDPLVRREELDGAPFSLAGDPYAAVEGADALVLMSPWAGVESLDLARLAASMARPVLLDAGNHLDPEAARSAGFEYHGVGR